MGAPRFGIPALVLAAALLPAIAHADDFGPHPDLRAISGGARALLAHRARLQHLEPGAVAISDVVVVGDQAVLSWEAGAQRGLMGLLRSNDRWWDAFDAAAYSAQCWSSETNYPLAPPRTAEYPGPPNSSLLHSAGYSDELVSAAIAHNAQIRSGAQVVGYVAQPGKPPLSRACARDGTAGASGSALEPSGGLLSPSRAEMSGYAFSMRYAPNDAAPRSTWAAARGRSPTKAEMLPDPAPAHVIANALVFFAFRIDAPRPVAFQRGGTLDVWFPFALQPGLAYTLLIDGTAGRFPPVRGTQFDNVVHFELPAFTANPGQEFAGEIDGNPL